MERFVMKSKLENLLKLREFLRGFAKKHNISHDELANLEIATGELVTNIIEHAQKFVEKESDIIFAIGCLRGNKIIIEIKYIGVSIDKTELEKQKVIEEFEFDELSESGRGVFLAHALLDEITYLQKEEFGYIFAVKKL